MQSKGNKLEGQEIPHAGKERDTFVCVAEFVKVCELVREVFLHHQLEQAEVVSVASATTKIRSRNLICRAVYCNAGVKCVAQHLFVRFNVKVMPRQLADVFLQEVPGRDAVEEAEKDDSEGTFLEHLTALVDNMVQDELGVAVVDAEDIRESVL